MAPRRARAAGATQSAGGWGAAATHGGRRTRQAELRHQKSSSWESPHGARVCSGHLVPRAADCHGSRKSSSRAPGHPLRVLGGAVSVRAAGNPPRPRPRSCED